MDIVCPSCGHSNVFDQPYRYHAGFGDTGFLYNEAGDVTLVWSTFDRSYTAVVGERHPWTLSATEQARLEERLLPAPRGGTFRFANPARCNCCRAPISGPMTADIYYVIYPASIRADETESGLEPFLRSDSADG